MVHQAALPLSWPARYGVQEYIVAECNAHAWQAVQENAAWMSPVTMIIGGHGSGKTHLTAIFHTLNHADVLQTQADMEAALQNETSCMVIDNVDKLTRGNAQVTETLFHLVNATLLRKGRLLLMASTPPAEWVKLPDLLSRLQASQQLTLQEPSEDMIKSAYQKLFADRGLLVDDKVLDFLALRSERSFDGINAIVDRLDVISLEQSRKITIPLIQSLDLF